MEYAIRLNNKYRTYLVQANGPHQPISLTDDPFKAKRFKSLNAAFMYAQFEANLYSSEFRVVEIPPPFEVPDYSAPFQSRIDANQTYNKMLLLI